MRRFPGYFRQILHPIFYALQNFDSNFPNLVAPPTGGSLTCLMRCKAYLVPNKLRKELSNWCYPSSNWYEIDQKNAVLNLALCCGAIWRHREKLKHMCTTTIHPVYNCSKKILENLLPVGLLVRTNLFIPSRFLDSETKTLNVLELWHLLSALGSDMRKNFLYSCTHIFPPKLLR